MELYDSFNYLKSTKTPYVLYFSGGRDSIVMLDLACKYTRGQFVPVFLYIVRDLEFQQEPIRYYEKKYDILVHQLPHWDVSNYEKLHGKVTRKLAQRDIDMMVRRHFDISMLAYGYRKDESMTRRSMISGLRNKYNVDEKFQKVYPIANFTQRMIEKYISLNRIKLPIEYDNGYRNIDQFKGKAIIYIKNNYPSDYEKIIKRFPLVEAEYVRQEGRL